MDQDIKERFEDHEEQLREHNGRLRNLEIQFAESNKTLEYLKDSQDEIKVEMRNFHSNSLASNNAILNTLNNFVINNKDNETKKTISKMDNKTKVIVQGIILTTAVVTGILSGKFLM